MVCAYVREGNPRAKCVFREGNPRALARGLSPVHMHNHTITSLLQQHACAFCAL